MASRTPKSGSATTQSGSASGSSDTSLSEQMRQNIRNMNDLVEELQLQGQQQDAGQEEQCQKANQEKQEGQRKDSNIQMQKFNEERRNILLQLQQEMSNYATIQDKFDEHEKSMQMIIQELQNEQQALSEALDDALADSTDNLEDLNNEVKDLNKQLGNMSEDNTCSICLSQWSTEGEHCLASLKCGHLFGRNCIRKSVRMHRQCPLCKKHANWRDVRKIYCSSGILTSNSGNESSANSFSGQSTSGYRTAGASGFTTTGYMGGNMYYDSDDSY